VVSAGPVGLRGNNMVRTKAFTLLELMVVIAILALLVSILLPSISRAKVLAKITKVHAELRGITIALSLYSHEHNQEIPPTRVSCSSRMNYELPIELIPYLFQGVNKDNLDIVDMPDAFTPTAYYKYRAVGTSIENETLIREKEASLWIPDGFPDAEKDTGKEYRDPETSPVRYAVYSLGPDPDSKKFDIPGLLPIPQKYWLNSPSDDAGVIVHYEDKHGLMHMSP
jgi:prepilin-type N-terminal cleavage/methylation domain-containing protein